MVEDVGAEDVGVEDVEVEDVGKFAPDQSIAG
jgi:hypothetical protein